LPISRSAFNSVTPSFLSLSTILALSISLLLTACGSGGSSAPPPPPPVTYTVGGTLTGLASGNSITLTDNGSDHLTLTANGPFTFSTKLVNGVAYALTLSTTTPTAQPCTSTYGAGTIDGADVTLLNVFCGLPGGPGTYTATGSLATARIWHTTTLLNNGTVLAAGGIGSGLGYLASSELYDPSTGSWTGTGALAQARANHTATLLPNGNVLVCGGVIPTGGQTILASSEIYNPSTGSWTATGSLNTGRWLHTATLLPNGKVLVVGGEGLTGSSEAVLTSAELYDPSTGVWTTTGSLNTARQYHTATLLPDGKVLIAGGEPDTVPSTSSAELYDPSTGTWTATGSLNTARQYHTATLLPSGKVLIGGGANFESLTVATDLASAELYDPSTGVWSSTGSLATERSAHTAVLLPSGDVLDSGGVNNFGANPTWLASSELYNPESGNWSPTGSLLQARSDHTSTLLTDGKVLITGGGTSLYAIATTAELYF